MGGACYFHLEPGIFLICRAFEPHTILKMFLGLDKDIPDTQSNLIVHILQGEMIVRCFYVLTKQNKNAIAK